MESTVSRPGKIVPIAKDAHKATHRRRQKAVSARQAVSFFAPHLNLLVERERQVPFARLRGLSYYVQGRFAASLCVARLPASQARS